MDRIRFLICLYRFSSWKTLRWTNEISYKYIIASRSIFNISSRFKLLYTSLSISFPLDRVSSLQTKKEKNVINEKRMEKRCYNIYIYIYNRIEFNLRFNISIPSRSFLDPFSISRKRTRLRFRGWMGRRRRIPVPRICSGFCARENGIPTVFRRWSGSVMGVWVKVVSGLIEG